MCLRGGDVDGWTLIVFRRRVRDVRFERESWSKGREAERESLRVRRAGIGLYYDRRRVRVWVWVVRVGRKKNIGAGGDV